MQKLWEEFLNPDLLRARLISASIYIAAFEVLKDSIVDRIKSFFWNGFDASGDKIDPKYKADVLSRNRSAVHASLDWLKDMGAISVADIGAFDRIKTCRNILAHRLLTTLETEGVPPDFDKCFGEMTALLRKIEVWWIREVEMSINSDFDGVEVDENEITSGRELGLLLLCTIALGDEKASRFYLDEFRKKTEGG